MQTKHYSKMGILNLIITDNRGAHVQGFLGFVCLFCVPREERQVRQWMRCP